MKTILKILVVLALSSIVFVIPLDFIAEPSETNSNCNKAELSSSKIHSQHHVNKGIIDGDSSVKTAFRTLRLGWNFKNTILRLEKNYRPKNWGITNHIPIYLRYCALMLYA